MALRETQFALSGFREKKYTVYDGFRGNSTYGKYQVGTIKKLGFTLRLPCHILNVLTESRDSVITTNVGCVLRIEIVSNFQVNNGHLFTCSTDKTTRSFNIQVSWPFPCLIEGYFLNLLINVIVTILVALQLFLLNSLFNASIL